MTETGPATAKTWRYRFTRPDGEEIEVGEFTGDEAAGFRQNFATQRRQAADQSLRAAIDALGKAIQTYYTPEQKQAFALTLDKLHDSAQPNANPDLALQAATTSRCSSAACSSLRSPVTSKPTQPACL